MSIVIDSQTIVKYAFMSYCERAMAEEEARTSEPETLHRQFLRQRNLADIKKVLAGEMTAEQLADQMTNREMELEDLADHDGLTGLLNYKGFVDTLTGDLEIIRQLNIPSFLFFLDIDKLKEFNDTMGKVNGNRLIKTYAQVLQQQTEQQSQLPSTIGRFGGDEFVLFLIGATKQQAADLAERIRQEIPEAIKQEFNDPTLDRTINIGITTIRPNDNALTLLERADMSLNQAKQTRNRVVFEGQPSP